MSLMLCPIFGTVECAAGCCFVCGGQGDEQPLRCPLPEAVIRIDFPLGWTSGPGDPPFGRRPTGLTTLTVLRPDRDDRKAATSAYVALRELHAQICGCDDPGKLGFCTSTDFAALDPAKKGR